MHLTKTETSKLNLRQLVWTCVAVVGIAAAFSSTANAHEYGHKSRVHIDPYVVIDRRHHMPRWLRQNHRFMRWYWRKQLNYAYHISWQRMYDLYKLERYYKRHPYQYRSYPKWYRKHLKRTSRGYYKRKRHYYQSHYH